MADHEGPAEPVEAAEADVHEQRRQLVEHDGVAENDQSGADPEEPDLPPGDVPRRIPNDVDPADAYEQTRAVEYDEDDYR